jgi:NitT/TauT family transport system permease protein
MTPDQGVTRGTSNPLGTAAAARDHLAAATGGPAEGTLTRRGGSNGLTTAAREPAASARWIRRHDELLVGGVAVLLALGLWQLSGLFLQPIFISTPGAVVPALFNLIVSGPLPAAFLRSLVEMVAGLIVAGVVGVGLGLLMGRIRILERALEPLVAFGNATPSIALLPVMEIWFGFATTARVAFIMVIAVWPLLVNTHAGVRAVRGRMDDIGKTFGMKGWQQIRYVYLPGTMPFIFVGARIALAVGAVGMILGGQEIGQTGLGGLTSNFGSYSETADLVATIVTTTGLAIFLFWGLRRVQAKEFPWIAATSAGRRDAR